MVCNFASYDSYLTSGSSPVLTIHSTSIAMDIRATPPVTAKLVEVGRSLKNKGRNVIFTFNDKKNS